MKRKVVGTIKMRNGSIIHIVEGDLDKLRGTDLPMKLVPTPNGEGYIVDEERLKEMLERD